MKIIVLGGGAAGFFGALSAKEKDPHSEVILLEKSAQLLSKVKISGGGRCNVTHACFDPHELIQHYPRGGKELLGPFTRFSPKNTIDWFAQRGAVLKTEADGRMFPVTDRSETIVECLLGEAKRLGVEIRLMQRVKSLEKTGDHFILDGIACDKILLATGSSPQGYAWAQHFGHTLVPPVPSLFTFNILDFSLADLAGVSIKKVKITLKDSPLEQQGPLLITHWGFSGPAALKLSAWGARLLHEKNYRAAIEVDWLPDLSLRQLEERLLDFKRAFPHQILAKHPLHLPRGLFAKFVASEKKAIEFTDKELSRLAYSLKHAPYSMHGKTTHKEEFVTCGGIKLSEVHFATMESRKVPGLHFAGEILDIDGLTGGFNFQNAWTTGYLAGNGFFHSSHFRLSSQS